MPEPSIPLNRPPGNPLPDARLEANIAPTTSLPVRSPHAEITPAILGAAVTAWAKTARGPFCRRVEDVCTAPEAQRLLSSDGRIAELANVAGIDRHLTAAVAELGTRDQNGQQAGQIAKNVIRLERLIRFYDDVATSHGTPELATSLAAKLESTRLSAVLVRATYDGDFDLRFQAALSSLYVELREEPPVGSRIHTVLTRGLAAGLVLSDTARELSGHALILFLGGAQMGVLHDFPSWNSQVGYNGAGRDLFFAFSDDHLYLPQISQKLMRDYPKAEWRVLQGIVTEAAFWAEYESAKNYDDVRRSAFFVGSCSSFPAMREARAKAESALDIFDRNPSREDSDWFGRKQRERVTLDAADNLAWGLQFAIQERNLGEMLLSFQAFERKANPTYASSAHVPTDSITSALRILRQQGITAENANAHPGRVMAAVGLMLFSANNQIVPAGYYIHADTSPDPSSGFRFTRIVSGPVVAQRFVKTADGKEFDQIVVDAKHGGYGYDLVGSITIPVTVQYIYRQIQGGSVVGEWLGPKRDLDWQFGSRFCTVFLPDVEELASTIGVSRESALKVISDHEADHAFVRHDKGFLARDPHDWVDHYILYAEKFAPLLAKEVVDTISFLTREQAPHFISRSMLEMSAIIREASSDLSSHRKMRHHFGHANVSLYYRVPVAVISGVLELHGSEMGTQAALDWLYTGLFNGPLAPFTDQWLVLPRNRARVPATIV